MILVNLQVVVLCEIELKHLESIEKVMGKMCNKCSPIIETFHRLLLTCVLTRQARVLYGLYYTRVCSSLRIPTRENLVVDLVTSFFN